MKRQSNGLMAFWSDIDADYTLKYQEWHNCEHIPERVSIPGFNRGCRYRAADGRPHFLMFYETDAPDVLNSPPYLAALDAPTPWSKAALAHFRNPERNVYLLLSCFGLEGPFVAPWITGIRFNLADEMPDATQMHDWMKSCADQTGVARVRLYQVDEAISTIMTSERKIYGGGPGAQQYLLMVEQSAPPDQHDAIKYADRAVPEMPGLRQNQRCDSYWLEIAQEKRVVEASGTTG